jgi:hypothetical protein
LAEAVAAMSWDAVFTVALWLVAIATVAATGFALYLALRAEAH